MSQAEGQQKNLVQSIDSLPTKGPLSCLDQDLLLLKATSAATLSCLGECLNILQRTQSSSEGPRASQHNHGARSGESALGPVPPETPSSTLSVQFPPPESSPSSKAQPAPLSWGSCPCLTGPTNVNICGKCCWFRLTFWCLVIFVPLCFFLWWNYALLNPSPLLKVCQKKTTLVPQVLNRRHACARSNKVLLIETKSAWGSFCWSNAVTLIMKQFLKVGRFR